MQAALDNVQSLSQELDTTVRQALAQDSIGQDGATNRRQTLSNLNRSTTNLAEDTEALRHNFFFRGFFKRRGFYGLNQLPRTEYLEACERRKNARTRKWLQASSLIIRDENGQEQLSETGRHLIDLELAPVVDSLPENVIVVEGYPAAGSPDEQYAQSRNRADLFRHYLEAHYTCDTATSVSCAA
jgi:phospholipid/cholesterol/gamma-HCH transport system substrate-binding protein